MVDYQSQFELNDSYYFTKLDFITWNRYFHVLQIFKKQKYNNILENYNNYQKMSTAYNPYGNGTACNSIFEHLKSIYE